MSDTPIYDALGRVFAACPGPVGFTESAGGAQSGGDGLWGSAGSARNAAAGRGGGAGAGRHRKSDPAG